MESNLTRQNRRQLCRGCAAVGRPAAVALGLALAAVGLLACGAPARAENLALHKPYSLAPKPSYDLCTDPDDATQLTDGEIFRPGDAHQFHVWKGTVGWHVSRYVMVVVDLQKRCHIDSISYHGTGGGHAQIYFPARSDFLVSENGVDYVQVRSVTPVEQGITEGQPGQQIKWITAVDINRTGRYVMLGLWKGSGSGYTFLDEIRVEGRTLPDQTPAAAKDAMTDVANLYITRVNGMTDPGGPTAVMIGDRRTHMLCNLRRIERARARVRKDLPVLSAAQALIDRTVEAQIEVLGQCVPVSPGEDEWRTFVATTTRLYGYIQGLPLVGRGYVVWDRAPWDPLMPHDMPAADVPALTELNVRMVGNEHESACLTVSNVTELPLALRVEPPALFQAGEPGEPAPGANKDRLRHPIANAVAAGPDGWLTLRETALVETGFGMVADALPELGEASLFTVEPMSSKQLWLSVSSARIPPGKHSALLRLRPVQTQVFKESQVRVNVDVLKTRLEGAPPLRTCGWEYPRFTEVLGQEVAAVQDQLRHHMDTFVVEVWLCGPYGTYGPDGRVVTPMDCTTLDRYLEHYRGGRKLLLYTSTHNRPAVQDATGVSAPPIGSPAWEKAFAAWYQGLVAHLRARGLSYDQFAFYPYDEPWTPELANDYLQVARAAKQADPQAQVFVTSPGLPLERLRQWLPYTDIYCLAGGPEADAKAQALMAEKKEVWYYGGAARKADHPIAVARRHFWRAFQLSIRGLCVWAYCDTGWQTSGEETGWTELDRASGYPDQSMIYRGKYGPVTSKRWEAWRDGVEDFWVLTILEQAHRQGRTQDDPRVLVAKALSRPPKAGGREGIDPLLLAVYADTDPADRQLVLSARVGLLEQLSRMEAGE